MASEVLRGPGRDGHDRITWARNRHRDRSSLADRRLTFARLHRTCVQPVGLYIAFEAVAANTSCQPIGTGAVDIADAEPIPVVDVPSGWSAGTAENPLISNAFERAQQDRFQRANRYRLRAEELRTVRETWMDTETRGILLRIALDYERMADQLDRESRDEALSDRRLSGAA